MSELSLSQIRATDGFAVGSAILSLSGSILILWHVQLKKGIRERLLCGLSIVDIIASFKMLAFAFFFHRVDRQPGIDCSMEGFLRVWLDNAAPLYSISLLLYFLLVVRYHYKDESLMRIEYLLHIFPVIYPLIFAVAGLLLDVYSPVAGFTVCGAEAYPHECKDNTDVPCKNGTHLYRWVYIPTTVLAPTITWAFLLVGSLLMVHAVWKNDNPDASYHHTRRVAGQSFQWCLCFVVTYFFGLVYICAQSFDPDFSFEKYFWLTIVCQTFFPLQGFADALVFFRPRYLSFRRNAGESCGRSLMVTLFTKSSAPTRSSMMIGQQCSALPRFVRQQTDDDANDTKHSSTSS